VSLILNLSVLVLMGGEVTIANVYISILSYYTLASQLVCNHLYTIYALGNSCSDHQTFTVNNTLFKKQKTTQFKMDVMARQLKKSSRAWLQTARKLTTSTRSPRREMESGLRLMFLWQVKIVKARLAILSLFNESLLCLRGAPL